MKQIHQSHHGYSYAGDYVYECSKQDSSLKRGDNIFPTSYTIMRMLSQVVSSRLKFTKSNEELDLVLYGLSIIRNYMSTLDLKRHETCNAAEDGIVWTENFQN